MPRTHAVIEITIPESVSIETVRPEAIPGWDAPDQIASREFGDHWLQELRSAVLLVLSFVARGRERNVLINPAHYDFSRITASEPEGLLWDERLFRGWKA